jgi:hypothetical protein
LKITVPYGRLLPGIGKIAESAIFASAVDVFGDTPSEIFSRVLSFSTRHCARLVQVGKGREWSSSMRHWRANH